MTDDEIGRLLAAADPLRREALRPVAAPAPDPWLREAIMTTTSTSTPRLPRRSPIRSRFAIPLGVGALTATALLGLTVLTPIGDRAPGTADDRPVVGAAAPAPPTPSAPLPAPYAAVLAPGWGVVSAVGLAAGVPAPDGDAVYVNGPDKLDLHLEPADRYEGLRADRASTGTVVADRIGDSEAQVIDQGAGQFQALWVIGDRTFELSGASFDSVTEFRDVAASVVLDYAGPSRIDAGSVAPGEYGAEVDRLLAGVPLPPGLTAADLSDSPSIMERETVGTWAYRAVACSWIERWAEAGPEDPARAEAVTAMGTVGTWPDLAGLPVGEDIETLAAGMAAGGIAPPSVEGQAPVVVEESYRSSLGCDQNPLLD